MQPGDLDSHVALTFVVCISGLGSDPGASQR